MNRKEQKKLTREKIFHTSIKLFIDKGYDNVTVDEIIHTIGISKGGFYAHFYSKDAILLEYSNQIHEDLQMIIQSKIGFASMPVEERVYSFFKCLIDFNITNNDGLVVLLQQSSKAGILDTLFHNIYGDLNDILAWILREGVISNTLKEEIDYVSIADYMMITYFYICKKTVIEMELSFNQSDFDKSVNDMIGVYLSGIKNK